MILNPTQTYSAETINASRQIASPNVDISTAMLAVSLSSYKAGEASTLGSLKEMNNQNKIADTANRAKALEEKLKAALTNGKVAAGKSINSEANAWSAEAKQIAKELRGLYETLGINSKDLAKLDNGSFSAADLEGMAATTKTVADKTLSANQMLNLELSKQNNAMSMMINFATKALDTLKQNFDRILR